MMKRSFFGILFFLIVTAVQAQEFQASYVSLNSSQGALLDIENANKNAYSVDFSQSKLNAVLDEANQKHPLEKTGKVLTFVGIPLTVLGAIMVSSADELYYNCTNGECEGDPQGGFGVVALGTGIGLTGTGIVLWTIGKKKRK